MSRAELIQQIEEDLEEDEHSHNYQQDPVRNLKVAVLHATPYDPPDELDELSITRTGKRVRGVVPLS